MSGGYLAVLPGMLAMGLGMGLSMPPSTEAITGALPPERQGVASALNDVAREFGTALGVALLGALLSAGYRDAMDSRLDGVHAQTLVPARESFVDGWQTAMWAGVALMAALFVYILAFGPRRPEHASARDDGSVLSRG